MSVGIIGAGNVGRALASAFARNNQSVVIGAPKPEKYVNALNSLGSKVELTSVPAAIQASDIVILAVPYSAAESIVGGVGDWRSKIIVDATNPIAGEMEGLSVGTTTSGAEEIAKHAHNARVVKAFNTTGAENLADSRYANGRIFMPICGDNDDAKKQVISLATLIGFEAIDMGELTAARYLEPFAMTWIHLAIKRGFGRRFAFGLLQRD